MGKMHGETPAMIPATYPMSNKKNTADPLDQMKGTAIALEARWQCNNCRLRGESENEGGR
jgi:hypothetical protein